MTISRLSIITPSDISSAPLLDTTCNSSYAFNIDAQTGGNRLLVAVFSYENNTTNEVTACTYNGTALTRVIRNTENSNPTTQEYCEVWVLQDPASGLNELACSFSTPGNDVIGVFSVWQGSASALSVGATLKIGRQSSTDATGIITTTAADSVVFQCASSSLGNGTPFTPASGNTKIIETLLGGAAAGIGIAMLDRATPTVGDYTIGATAAAANYTALTAVEIVESASSDTTAPTLTSPSATATGATTASGSVTTNEANGTLYYLASANASESVATVKAGSSQAVSVSGVQNVTLTGLTASTSYYLHFVHTDAAANDSTVATSAQFTTSAAGDTTPPTLTGPTGTATGATTASGTVSTNEDTGTLYWLASANASETGTAVKAGSSQAVSAVGTQNVTVSGLTASTAYYLHYLHRDGAGNDSDVATSAQFTTSAAPDTTAPTLTGSVTFSSITQTSYTAQWPAGSDNVAVTGYEYQIGGTAGAWTDAGNNLSAAITGRTAGTTETVYVRAYDAAGNRSTPAISGSVTLDSIPAAGINVTEPLKNNTGTVLASQSGVRVAVLQAADLVSVFETSGLTTNASGILATINDAAIITGQQYHVAIKLADGGVGITGPITAS